MSDATPQPTPRPPRRRLRRAVLLTLVLSVSLGIATVAAALFLTGRALVAPDWLHTRIESRISHEMPGADIRFGDMVLVVNEGWIPRLKIRDVRVTTPAGAEIVSLNEMTATIALRPLLDGVVQPRSVVLSGIFVTLTRDENGAVALSAGQGAAPPIREAATLPQLIGQLDQVLTTPALSGLRTVDLRALTLQYKDLRAQRAWTVDGGRLRLSRDGTDLTLAADLAVLSGNAEVATLAANYTSQIGETAAEFGITFDHVAAPDIAAQGPVFAWLDVLRAPISGAVRSGLEESGRFTPLNATLQIGAGVVQPNTQTQAIPFEGARSYFSYDPAEKVLRFDELSVRSKWVSGLASGTALLGGVGAKADLSELVGQFTIDGLVANPFDLYPQPVSLETADVDFQLKLNPLRIKIGRLQISDQGKTLLLDGGLQADTAGWRVALDAKMDGIGMDRVLGLWPKGLKPKTRTWLAKNLLQGMVQNVDAAFRLTPDKTPTTYLAFDFRDAAVKFLKNMPPVTQGEGHFSLTGKRLVVALDSGNVVAPEGGQVDVQGSSFILPDVGVKGGTPAVIRLTTASSMTAVLSLLNQDPLNVMDKVKMPVVLADGIARLQGTLAVPLRKGAKPSDVQYHFEGDLLSVRTDTLIKNRALQARRLRLRGDNKAITIAGKGRIDGVAFDGSWTQPIGSGSDKSTLRGQVALDEKTLNTFGIALPPGTVEGAGTGEIALDFQRGAAPAFALASDLRGIRLKVPQVSWTKSSRQSGRLRVSGQLGDVPRVETLEVSGPGLTAKGSVALKSGGALDRVRFDQMKVGDWLNVPLDLVGQGPGKPVQVVLRGGTINLARARFGSSPNKGPPGPPMQISLDRLQVTDTIALTDLNGRFGTAKGLDGTFEARLNGGTAVQGRVFPQNGRSAVRLVSSDAGGVVRSAGLLEQVVGGDLSLTLLPVGSDDAYDGRVTASGVRIKDAPGIAGLLNAISVVGLVNELNGDGIYFDDIQGDFRLTPNRLTLTSSSAVGASMGLSMDGIFALDSGQINMQGVISPVYLLNGIGSILTRRGEGLIGFNYTLRGPAKDPKVSVNPLSVLTPGMFREIFRKAPPDLPEVEGVTGSTLPEQQAKPKKGVVYERPER